MSQPLDEILVQKVKLRKDPPKPQPIAVEPVRDIPDLGEMTVQLVQADVGGTKPKVEDVDPEPAASIIHEPDRDPALTVAEEIKVYQGSLYLWVILWLLVIMGSTQVIKRVFEYPLRKKRPPLKLPKLGWELHFSRDGWEWFIKLQPAIWCWPTTLYFGPTALEAMGYEFTAFQSLMFAPAAAISSLGVWAMLPKRIKRWLNGVREDDAQASDLRKISDLLDEVSDAEIREQLSALHEDHSVVEDG